MSTAIGCVLRADRREMSIESTNSQVALAPLGAKCETDYMALLKERGHFLTEFYKYSAPTERYGYKMVQFAPNFW